MSRVFVCVWVVCVCGFVTNKIEKILRLVSYLVQCKGVFWAQFYSFSINLVLALRLLIKEKQKVQVKASFIRPVSVRLSRLQQVT